MRTEYVIADLVRNPRRTLSTMTGAVLGVGLFCGVLFFVDGTSASMSQRAVAPLAIDMQRIVTQRAGVALELSQTFVHDDSRSGQTQVDLVITNVGDTPANEVTIRSVPAPGLVFIEGSAEIDGAPIVDVDGNPFARGAARSGHNVGTIEPSQSLDLRYRLEPDDGILVDDTTVSSSYSTRESVSPIPANQPATVDLADLAEQIGGLPGVANARSLSIADLGVDTLRAGDQRAPGRAKIFGFDTDYDSHDETIEIVTGSLSPQGAVLTTEAATALDATLGDDVNVTLPDGSSIDLTVTGVADLSRSRSLFSSRRGGDLETFIYVRNAVIVSPELFADTVFPAFERAATSGGRGRLKNPPIREIDITLRRELLDADPATAVAQTEQIAADVMAVAEHQDYLLDNVSNTLNVAADDARVAKRLFVFLGVPGLLLAAILAVYAGNVLAEAQRREQAILRIRGASRRDLLRMLATRTALLTGVGSVIGLLVGYLAAAAVLGQESLDRASNSSLAVSAATGTLGGFAATGAGLYLTGRRTIDREINEDRARLASRPPLWRRARLDLAGLAIIVVGTTWAVLADAFAGAPGSVYFGRSVDLNLSLLVLPVAVWMTGSLVAARLIGQALHRGRPASSPKLGRVGQALYRRSVGRRPWAISNGAIVASLIVALATSLGGFTASYDHAKTQDARYANGADIRVTPSAATDRLYTIDDASKLNTASIDAVTPVIYGLSNVILRSDRTSDPANLAAVAPDTYTDVAPIDTVTATDIDMLKAGTNTILLNSDMAAYLQTEPGDTINVLLARATPEQRDIEVTVIGLFERLPGFPDGADAVMNIDDHTATVPTKGPDFFLASTAGDDMSSLSAAAGELLNGPAADQLQIDTRATVLDRDQSSLAALNIAGLVDLDSGFALAMATVAIAIFVFGLLLQRRREYVTLRAQGLEKRTIRLLIAAEAATVAATGTVAGLLVGSAMGYYFVAVLRPLFVLDPSYTLPLATLALPVLLVLAATVMSALIGSRMVNTLEPTELLRDD